MKTVFFLLVNIREHHGFHCTVACFVVSRTDKIQSFFEFFELFLCDFNGFQLPKETEIIQKIQKIQKTMGF